VWRQAGAAVGDRRVKGCPEFPSKSFPAAIGDLGSKLLIEVEFVVFGIV
jgi:hypothetical protein